MNNTRKRSAIVAGLLAASLIAAACSSSKTVAPTTTAAATTTAASSTSATATTAPAAATTPAAADTTVAPSAGSSAPTTAPAKVSGTLQGSGSTFQLAYEQAAIDAFQKANAGTTITYGGGGSGKGRTDLKTKIVDFAGSDSPYADADKPADAILYFPIQLGAITVSYNLSGVDKLQLSPDTIAGIFDRTIKTWNDPAIAADNPGVTLPATAITVAHRSDGSGTTQNFTEWLVATAKSWTLKSGSTVEWPSDTQGGTGNQGVAQIVGQTDGAVGYIDLSDAKAANLKFADVKNSAGTFITPNADSVTVAGDGIKVADNLIFKAYNSSAPTAYPITAQSWVIVYAKQSDANKAALVKAWISYLLNDGQKLLADLDYAPLPKSIQDKAIAQLDQITS